MILNIHIYNIIYLLIRENKLTALSLLTGYHVYTLVSVTFRLSSFHQAGLELRHTKLLLTILFALTEGPPLPTAEIY